MSPNRRRKGTLPSVPEALSAPWLSLVLAVLGLATIAYWPGLKGPFLLDDELNLSPLGTFGAVDSLRDIGAFILDGATSPLGRPLTLLSYTLNAQDWPADPWWFKFTNLLLHLVNGGLIVALVSAISRPLTASLVVNRLTTIGAAAIWLLHPIQISTVFYVSQRMNLLATLFVLLALLGYVQGRLLEHSRPMRGLWLRSAAFAVGATLAVLSKETGVLLVLFVLVLEATLLRTESGWARPVKWRLWAALFLWFPIALVVSYFAWQFDWIFPARTTGGIPLFDTWMTQARVLVEYLGFVFLPFFQAPDLFDDDFVASAGLLSPASTLVCAILIVALLATGIWQRRRRPMLAFGILWFFAGHALESTIVGMQPVYEYRNYLPLLGPSVAIAWYVTRIPLPGRPWAAAALLGVFGLGLAAQTAGQAELWGDKLALAQSWAARHPESVRAQHFLAQAYAERQRHDDALSALMQAKETIPNDFSLDVLILQLRCARDELSYPVLNEAFENAAISRYQNSIYHGLGRLEEAARAGVCPPLDRRMLARLLEVLVGNPRYRNTIAQSRLHYRRAVLLSELGQTDAAVKASRRSLAAKKRVNVAYNTARWLVEADQPRRALRYLAIAREVVAPDDPLKRYFFDRDTLQRDQALIDQLEKKARARLPSGDGL